MQNFIISVRIFLTAFLGIPVGLTSFYHEQLDHISADRTYILAYRFAIIWCSPCLDILTSSMDLSVAPKIFSGCIFFLFAWLSLTLFFTIEKNKPFFLSRILIKMPSVGENCNIQWLVFRWLSKSWHSHLICYSAVIVTINQACIFVIYTKYKLLITSHKSTRPLYVRDSMVKFLFCAKPRAGIQCESNPVVKGSANWNERTCLPCGNVIALLVALTLSAAMGRM